VASNEYEWKLFIFVERGFIIDKLLNKIKKAILVRSKPLIAVISNYD